jgi:hypothetical protein
VFSPTPHTSDNMPRAHNIPVPDSDTEIIEVTAYRKKTKRGVKIKKTEVPMAQSLPTQPPKSSSNRRRTKRTADLHPDIGDTIEEENRLEALENQELIGDFPEAEAEHIQRQNMVQ